MKEGTLDKIFNKKSRKQHRKDFDVDKETCRLYKLTAADYSHLEEVIYQSSK